MSVLAKSIVAFTGCLLAASSAVAEASKINPPWRVEEQKERRADLARCFEQSASLFDDRISPADVIASAVAWHCEADGKAENYWVILSMRRSNPDLNDTFYRDLALPYVLRQRVRRLQ